MDKAWHVHTLYVKQFKMTSKQQSGSVQWQSPSNIALVKYWGKYGRQYPRNASISFTLSKAHTNTTLNWYPKQEAQAAICLNFTFEGQENEAFASKIVRFLDSILDEMPFLVDYDLQISSGNSFPHSSGIASSASSMSALALCLCEMEALLAGKAFQKNDPQLLQRASHIARLGSGSAARSVFPIAAIWGVHEAFEGSANDYAIPAGHLMAPIFHTFQDTILIVSKAEKEVSSRAGHALMEGNPFADLRYQQANENLVALMKAMKEGDLDQFISLVEAEALSLHALMMTSTPSYLLMRPNTLAIIEKIRAFRAATACPVCFTLDAGPNVHLLYPEKEKEQVQKWIVAELKDLCEEGYLIEDFVG